jgi:hypothetical protein
MDRLAAELADGRRPDLALQLRIERAAALDPPAALHELQAVRSAAQRIGHVGAVFAAHVRAAAAAAKFAPMQACSEARGALALHEDGLRSTTLLPAEPWLHIARALQAGGDARAEAVRRDGVDWLQRTAREQVPEPFRDSFLQRNPVNRALLSLARRTAG